MNEKELRSIVERIILSELAKAGEPFVPVMSSNHHAHLSQRDVEALFGPGYQLTKMRDLVQPGQYACNERVLLETPKGKMMLRIVGPARKETQVELSATDAVKLGLNPPVRMSGDLAGSPGCTLCNGDKRVTISQGVIIAARHLHLSPEEAVDYGVKDGDIVSLRVEGQRALTLENVIVRSGEGHLMEAHIDKDEANACGLRDGQLCRVLANTGASAAKPASACLMGALQTHAPATPAAQPPAPKRSTMLDISREPRRLLTEEDVRNASRDGFTIIRHGSDAIVTPLARDTASDKGIELVTAIDS